MKRLRLPIVILLLMTLSVTCTDDETPMNQYQTPLVTNPSTNNLPNANQSYSYLALGDSYTFGQGVDEVSRWPNQLKIQLLKKSIDLSPVDIIAQTGWTTEDLLIAIEAQKPEQHDLVSLLIGVNNQFQKRPFSQFESEFQALLEKTIVMAGGKQRLFVVSIPDYGVTRFGSGNPGGIATEINGYNAYMQQQCIKRGILYIDITEISRSLGASNGALADDGLHPSGAQYLKWVEKILPEVITLLQNENN